MNEITKQLAFLGLTPNESALYLAALECGTAGMTDLAHRAKLKRTTAYVTFASLQEKGLMGSYVRKGRTRFTAAAPVTIKRQLHDRLTAAAELIPQLEALTPHRPPRVSYYEGKEGYLIAARESLANPNTTIHHIGSLKQIHAVVGMDYDLNHYIPARLNNGIFIKALYPANEIPAGWQALPDQLREIRSLPAGEFTTSSTLIWDDAVAFFSGQDELFTLIVHSADIAAAERAKFKLIWDQSLDK